MFERFLFICDLKANREEETERWRESAYPQRFSPEMFAVAMAGPGAEPGLAGTPVIEPLSVALQMCSIAGKQRRDCHPDCGLWEEGGTGGILPTIPDASLVCIHLGSPQVATVVGQWGGLLPSFLLPLPGLALTLFHLWVFIFFFSVYLILVKTNLSALLTQVLFSHPKNLGP